MATQVLPGPVGWATEDTLEQIRDTIDDGVAVSIPGLPGPVFTQVPVTVGEVAVPAANKAGRATVSVKALAANGDNVYVGLAGVATTTGYELAPGDSIDLDADDTVALFAVSATGTQRVSVCEI